MKRCVIDLETTFSMVDKISAKKSTVSDYGDCFNPNNRVVLVGLLDLQTDKYVSFDMSKPSRLEQLKRHLDKYDALVGHNIKYDYLWLKQLGLPVENKKLYDTLLLEYIRLKGAHKQLGLGLNLVAPRHGGKQKNDAIKAFWGLGVNTDEIPMTLLSQYLYEDCQNTAMIFRSQAKDPEILRQSQFCEFYLDLSRKICELEWAGAKFDDKVLDDVTADIDSMLNVAAADLSSVVADLTKDHEFNDGKPLNLDSPSQMMQLLYSLKLKKEKKDDWKKFCGYFKPLARGADDRLKAMVEECFDKLPYGARIKVTTAWIDDRKMLGPNGVSTGSVAIEKLQAWSGLGKRQQRLIDALTAYSKASTWKSTNLAGVLNGVKSDGYIHGKFNMAVTSTRRFSSSEPNMQNWPREGTNPLKKLITSRYPGGYIINADYAQLEFRVAGLLSGDAQLIKDVSDGFDIHGHSAAMVFGEKYTKADKAKAKELRTIAKRTTFKFQYGAMPKNKIEQGIYDAFYGKYRTLAQWQEKIEYHIARDKEYVCPFTGSVFAFPEARHDNKNLWLTKAKNYPVQYLAAVINACGAIGLQEALQEYDERARWMLTVHDSNVVDVPKECLDDAVAIIKEKMQDINPIFQRYFKKPLDILLGVDVSYGNNWYSQEEYKHDRNEHAAAA